MINYITYKPRKNIPLTAKGNCLNMCLPTTHPVASNANFCTTIVVAHWHKVVNRMSAVLRNVMAM